MKILIFILIISFLINISVSAQKNKIHFRFINQFAMVGGESHISTAFQTVNGIKFSNFFSGAGIGIDYYRYRTLPLFFDGRWFFGNEKRCFLYGDIGYDFPMKDKPGKEIFYDNSYRFNGGVYTDVGIGCQVHLYKKTSILFSLGYSSKNMKVQVNNSCRTAFCPVDYYKHKYDYNFNRMILKAGLVF